MGEILTYKRRVEQLLDYSAKFFFNQVAGGVIHIENEASMQLHLSNILLQLGRLYEFSVDEHFNILLEKKIDLASPTIKSANKKARVDIWIELSKANEVQATAAIELKYLKKTDNAAVTDARYSVYKDLENLEQYHVTSGNLTICEIVYSNNTNFLEKKGTKFSIADDTVISSYDGDATYGKITLSNQYPPLKWDRYGEHNFLMITLCK